MPNNKKKKGKEKHQQAHHDDGQRYDAMPSFPPPETTEETIQRLLGYERTSFFDRTHDGTSCKVTLGSTSDTLRVDFGFGEEGEILEVHVKEMPTNYAILPDYDRKTALFPIFNCLKQSHPTMNMTTFKRRPRACLRSVPADERETYEKFIDGCDRLDSMKIGCCSIPIDSKDHGQDYVLSFVCRLMGSNDFFTLGIEAGEVEFSFHDGRGSTACLEKSYLELTILLIYVIMCRTSMGTMEIQGEASKDYIIERLLICLRMMNLKQKHWSEALCLSIRAMEHSIECRSSLSTTCFIARQLGHAFEANGLYEHAALFQAEAGDQLYKAKHRDTSTVYGSVAVAWAHAGKLDGAQRFYAKALRCLHFIHHPSSYSETLFFILRNLSIMYGRPDNVGYMRLAATLHALIIAAGVEGCLELSCAYDSATLLRPSLCACGKDRITRVIQFIVDKSDSVEGMRKAILDCSNPRLNALPNEIIDAGLSNIRDSTSVAPSTAHNNNRQPKKRPKDTVRKQLHEFHGLDDFYRTQCCGCGEYKREKSELKVCSCKTAYYCNEECQLAHWTKHKAQCKAARKAMCQQKQK